MRVLERSQKLGPKRPVQPAVTRYGLCETHYLYNNVLVIPFGCKALRSIYKDVCPRDILSRRLSSHRLETRKSCELNVATHTFIIRIPQYYGKILPKHRTLPLA
jgi:hypothetical protein